MGHFRQDIRFAVRMLTKNPGFTAIAILVVELDPSLAGYNEARGRELFRRVVERLRALPGVEGASVAATVPFGMVSLGREVALAGDNGQEPDPARAARRVGARFNSIGADYFGALGLRLLRGRTFNAGEADTGLAPRVAIIDDKLAERLFPNEDPLGKRIQFGGGKPGEPPKVMEIVGIAPDIREHLLGSDPDLHVFVPFGQEYQSNVNIHLKIAAQGKAAEDALLLAVRREIRAVDEGLPILGLKTLRAHLESSIEMWIVRTGACFSRSLAR